MWHATIHASRFKIGERQSFEADIRFEFGGSHADATAKALQMAIERWPLGDGYERHFVREICFRSEG